MTTPPVPPTPPAPPAPPAPPPAPTSADLARLQAALDEERRQRAEDRKQLDKLRADAMTDAEKAAAARAEAEQAAALRLAAAEFRAQAAGRIANPDAALAVLDLARLIGKDGEPDKTAIGTLVEQLAVVPPPPGKVPAGPRDPANGGEADWVRAIRRSPPASRSG